MRVAVPPTGAPVPSQAREAVSGVISRPPTPAGLVPLEIILPGDIRIRVGGDCDGPLLGRVLAALREAGC